MEKLDIEKLKPIFWDVDITTLSWDTHRDFIVKRVLLHGNLKALRWLRSTMSDSALKAWLLSHDGGGLPPRQLWYWQIVLGLPADRVARWEADQRAGIWHRRNL